MKAENMNMEIKFRALVVADEIKRMIYFDLPEMDNGLWAWPMDKTICHIDEYLSPLMRYTGLKDKKNNDIYEGDITEVFRTKLSVNFYHGIKSVVEFNEGAFGYWLDERRDFISFECNTNFRWNNNKSDLIEVIGNIYENPELVK